jgi:aromatic ring hydroxylase
MQTFPTMRSVPFCDLGAPNLKFICRTGFAGRAAPEDYPLANRFDEIDTLGEYRSSPS